MKKIIKFLGYASVVVGTHGAAFATMLGVLLATDRFSMAIQNQFLHNVVLYAGVIVMFVVTILILGWARCVSDNMHEKIYKG